MTTKLSITCVLVASLAAAEAAEAATFFVNETIDNVDAAPGDGLCYVSFTGKCSLRAAILEANALPGADVIMLGPGTFTLTLAGAGEDLGFTGDLDIRESLDIRGAGRSQTVISANFLDRVIDIPPLVGGGWVALRDLELRYGSAPTPGGGLRSSASALFTAVLTLTSVSIFGNLAPGGAGIYSEGPLNLWKSEVAFNFAIGTGKPGGGIWKVGNRLTVGQSSIHDNGASAPGGGIYHQGSSPGVAQLSIFASTVSGNFPDGVTATNLTGATSTTVDSSTIADNGSWGVRVLGSGTAPLLTCSIVSGHTTADCASATVPPLASGGYTLSQDGSCADVQTDLVGDPLLGPLTGGPAKPPARPATLGSPAIDGGGGVCLISDQWDRSRTMDGDRDGTAIPDIGALEDVLLFANGFESGETLVWSSSAP